MRILISLSLALSLHADPLTDADRAALEEKLEELASDTSPLQKRFTAAVTALKQAAASDDAALELYENSVKLVRFEREYTKPNALRDFHDRNKDILGDSDFKRALRHRYTWMLISLKASRLDKSSFHTLAPDIEKGLVAFLKDAPEIAHFFAPSKNPVLKDLTEPVLSGLEAESFGLETLPIDEAWPQRLFPLKDIYEVAVFPPYRNLESAKALAAAWDQLISFEKRLAEAMAFGDDKSPEPSGAFDRFTTRIQPQLLWDKEMDLFRAGDERGAATRMYEILESNITSPDAQQWTEEFKELVLGTPEDE